MPDAPVPRPVPRAVSARPYGASPAEGGQAAAGSAGPTPTLQLAANEGPPPPLDAAALVDPDLLRLYPSTAGLEDELAGAFGVAPERVVVTAGGDDAIDRACRAFVCPGRTLIQPVPAFEMFERCAHMAGADVVSVPWGEGAFPADAMLDAVTDATGMLVVVSPDNPTGRTVPLDTVRSMAKAAPHAVVLLDAAYEEFADAPLTPAVIDLPNVLVVRTFSKAWSLAGVRVGYAVGHASTIDVLRRVVPPFPVSRPSIALARAAFAQPGGRDRYVEAVRSERDRLALVMDELGLAPRRSQTNFVLGRSPRSGLLRDGLAALGIAVRTWPGHPLLSDAVRITCPGDSGHLARVERAMRTVLDPDALLLDMDGVLADVSGSYREAIRLTAEHFGIEITAGEIEVAKSGTGVNNDWWLTRDLLRERGVEVSRDAVRHRFEQLYRGVPGRPGLEDREALLCRPEWLRGLAERLPVAVVTGRPRRDAERFLERFELVDAVSALVCMEDAAAKPDPEPVRVAMKRLGVRAAWLCGDTPDDVLAARAAGVLPVGIGDNPGLPGAGAWRVLDHVEQVERLLNEARRR